MRSLSKLLSLAAFAPALIGAVCASINEERPIPSGKADARRLRTGSFRYRDIHRGQEAGRARITIQRITGSENFRFSTEITGEFGQCWESVATRLFEPVSAKLSFGQSPCDVPTFDIGYRAGRVSGFAVSRKDGSTPARRVVDDAVPGDIVDQRIDWAYVLASDFENEKNFEFRVYDPGTGISRAFARVEGTERIQVPAGSFDAYRIVYRIEKSGGAETYQVLATKGADRMMVREEFSNGVTTDLVDVAGSN
ncbi:MAG TPA: hypothetical protein VJA66_03840 [Thermoanaerobaculia bacterium]